MGMIDRCQNPKSCNYPRYGARGIRVCDRWQTFENFREDMGDPSDGLSIDRIDGDGDYEPANCRWATKKEQSSNMRSNVKITFRGVTHCATEWGRLVGINAHTILGRLKSGWPASEALTTLPGTRRA